MELINGTRMTAGYSMGLDPAGHQYLVVVIKGTFQLPSLNGKLELTAEQMPLVMADTFTGAPGLSAPVVEADFVLRKPFCDVVLHGSAHAPGGRPVDRVAVGLKIGEWQKSFCVLGDRVWTVSTAGVSAGRAEPFVRMPISYDTAFGGFDGWDEDPSKHAWFMENPIGCGFHRSLRSDHVDGSRMPNTEGLIDPILTPNGSYRPMAFGPIGRNWHPRREYAGTYDQHWLDEHFPFLPPDFDDRYCQCAPADQLIAHTAGGQTVTLVNLTPEGRLSFELPRFDAAISLITRSGEREEMTAVLDTLVFEPDLGRLTATWRFSRRVRRSLREVDQVFIGRRAESWWISRDGAQFPVPVVTIPVRSAASERGSGES